MNWFLATARQRAPRVRLFCLPYAGGSASVYRTWGEALGGDVEVLSAQLAGRGWRLREAPVTALDELSDQVAAAIGERADVPFAVFGHSMGAWVGLEVVRRLESAGHEPVVFFASGRQSPGLGCTQPRMAHLDDDGFVAEVQTRYGGIPAEVMAEPELLELLLPALRADIGLLERYEHRPSGPISTPIHALVGARDPVVSLDDVRGWAEETAGGFELTTLPGGHFYFQPDGRALFDVIRAELGARPAGAGGRSAGTGGRSVGADGRPVCRTEV